MKIFSLGLFFILSFNLFAKYQVGIYSGTDNRGDACTLEMLDIHYTFVDYSQEESVPIIATLTNYTDTLFDISQMISAVDIDTNGDDMIDANDLFVDRKYLFGEGRDNGPNYNYYNEGEITKYLRVILDDDQTPMHYTYIDISSDVKFERTCRYLKLEE